MTSHVLVTGCAVYYLDNSEMWQQLIYHTTITQPYNF